MRFVFASILLAGSVAQTLGAQAPSIYASYGVWRHDTVATIWAAGFTRPLIGPFDYGAALTHLDDRRSPLDRTQTGGELSLGVGRDGSGLYFVGAAELAMKHDDGSLNAAWSAGAGAAVRVLPFLSLGFEARYRAEDRSKQGFWHLDPSDRRGGVVLGRASLLFGRTSRRVARRTDLPSNGALERAARRRGIRQSELAARIVSTAVDVMGTPYRWGGGDGNGYDCSGLIEFAYREHGIALPRISRDQVASGRVVDRDVGELAPGDILGFAVEGDQITHVGLYVGDGQFIHSASGGVKISSLAAKDPDSLWWQRRWATARRVLE